MNVFSDICVCQFVCEFVCELVCLHDNFQRIKRRMMKLGGYVYCTKISLEFEFGGSRSKVKLTRDRKQKSVAFFPAAVLGGASCVVRQFYAGGKSSACCLLRT